MAKIKAFRAIRPSRDKVHLVATRPYYTYKKNVLKAKLEDNPYTFLHIINPEFGLAKKTKPNSPERFKHVLEKYQNFRNEEILIKDEQEHIYLYSQTNNGRSCYGVIAGASINEYLNGQIKIHESTLSAREEIFTKYLEVVGFNAEPVLLTYKGSKEIDDFLKHKMTQRAEFEFTTTDKITHELWVLSSAEAKSIKNYFESIQALYIADGHHRSASSVRYWSQKNQYGKPVFSNEEFFLSFMVEENLVQIFAFHRLVKNLNGLTKDEFVDRLSRIGNLEKISTFKKPTSKNQFIICLPNEYYVFDLRGDLIPNDNPAKQIDAELLTNNILTPILGIEDIRQSDKIEFFPDVEDTDKILNRVNSGKMAVAFFLFPCTMEDVRKVADAKLFMPPKSTRVEPKLRSGLTIYPLHDD